MKRLTRVQGEAIKPLFDELKLIQADYILADGSVIHGILFSVSGNTLVVKNALRNKVKLLLDQLVEVVFDKESSHA